MHFHPHYIVSPHFTSGLSSFDFADASSNREAQEKQIHLIMASSSFRESMNSLGWSRRDADIPVNTGQTSGLLTSIKSLNPFGSGGYVQLPSTEGPGAPLPARTRREEEEGWFARRFKRSVFSCLLSYLLLHRRCIGYAAHYAAWKQTSRGLTLDWSQTLTCVQVSRWDRLLLFGGLNIGALACFAICFIFFPWMMAFPRKFAIL